VTLTFGKRAALLAALTCAGIAGQAVMAETAGAVTVDKIELRDGQLRVQGTGAPNIFIIASSTTSSAGFRADPSGAFKIQGSGFTAPDCRVTVSDRRTPTATVTLPGCTPSVEPVSQPAPPSGSCVITPAAPATLTADAPSVVNFETTGCNTTFNSGATPTPVQWTVVAGSIPTGMTGPTSQGTTAGNIIGTPTVPGTYSFTLRVTDQVGATDEATFTATVTAA
jgi:hypothetical protein